MNLMSKVTKKLPPTPSSTAYKDVSKKFNVSHEIKSFLDTLYTHLCAEYPCAEALVNENYVTPELARGADTEAKKDHSRHYGPHKTELDVKKVVGFIYSVCSEGYQQAIISKYTSSGWKLLKTVQQLIEFVGLIKSIKLKEKGSKASVVAKARKAIASIKQFDDENGAAYVVRAMKSHNTCRLICLGTYRGIRACLHT